MQKSDYSFLNEFFYQAIFIPKGAPLPPREIINEPEIYIYIKEFGKKIGDSGIATEQNGSVPCIKNLERTVTCHR